MGLCMNSYGVTIQMKATEQYMVALTFESVYEILWCDHLNESY